MRLTALIPLTAVVLLAAAVCGAGEIGFVEDFALAKDRAAALKQLVPGTDEYYYYECLHYQNLGNLRKVDETLADWLRRHGHTSRAKVIENRQALLKYPANSARSLEHIRSRLGILFNHQREVLDRKRKRPAELDPRSISRQTLTAREMARSPRTITGFEDRAMDWMVGIPLHPDQRRHLLRKLQRPDYPNLVRLVVDDLNYKYSRGFGAMPIHTALLLDQLHECAKLKDNLLNQNNYVTTMLTKLRPSDDVDWRFDAKERQAYLERLWAFVSRLAPVHNSLKANVLYHRLMHDRAMGVYDKDRFMRYIKLPRTVNYANPKYLALEVHRRYHANLSADYYAYTVLSRIGNDEPLVRSYLLHYFAREGSYKPYADYISDTYLKYLFAEAKIVGGKGTPREIETWCSMLPPARYQALKERVDLDFAHTNKKLFAPGDAVRLDVDVKNVRKLIVKVYQINAANYYRANGREVDTDINLDGLVANTEKTIQYTDPPLHRLRRRFDFKGLAQRGTYIVELIGNGKSSRAVVRKGRLRYLARTSSAGHVMTVLDESNRKVPDARVLMGGREFAAGKDGTITVPYSNRPGRVRIILSAGKVATLDYLSHESERYSLSAGIHVEREQLLTGSKARVIVRPTLQLNGEPVTLSIVEEPTLMITSVDGDGVRTTKEVRDFKLYEDRESTYEFNVPKRLRQLYFVLRAKVKSLSQNKKINLQAARTFTFNGVQKTEFIEDLHFTHAGGAYYINVRGRSGEPKANRPVQLTIKHRDFRQPVNATLQTDVKGRVALGKLPEITSVTAQGPQGPAHTWVLPRDRHTIPGNVHARVGEAIQLPYMGSARQPQRSEVSLLERRGGTFLADRFKAVRLEGGMLRITGLPVGDYDLLLKESGHRITVRLTGGEKFQGYVLGGNRHLQVKGASPLQIVSVKADKDTVRIQLANATKFARVHVAATRYMPDYRIYTDLDSVSIPGPQVITLGKLPSGYVSGRTIGDEHRYILDRKYAKKYPGNMLKRPSLLLNPWAIRKTDTGRQKAAPGSKFYGTGGGRHGGRASRTADKRPDLARAAGYADLDFLPAAAVVLMGLRADKNGLVTVKRADLGAKQQLHVMAIDPVTSVYREATLPEVAFEPKDLTLRLGLDAKKHFTEQKQITVVPQGGKFVLTDIKTSSFEAYDSIARAYVLYVTLSRNPTLVEFGFIVNWPKLKPEEKRAKYSKYACHELSFFLSRKDPAFFEAVIIPYLRNKRDKTFMDHYLLGDDLSGYLKPWAHGRLNVVERILLAQRVKADRGAAARHVRELWELLPPNIPHLNALFRTAVRSRSLDTADAFGLRAATEKATEKTIERLAVKAESRDAPRLVAGTMLAGPSAKTASRRPLAPSAKPAMPPPPSAPKPLAKKRATAGRQAAGKEARRRGEAAEGEAKADGKYFAKDTDRRKAVRQLYRKLDKTKEWVENNYYHLPIEMQTAALVTVNGFWRDYAAHVAKGEGDGRFLSRNMAEASRSFPEIMLALSVLDVPFEAAEHKREFKDQAMHFQPGNGLVAYHKEIKPAQPAAKKVAVLVSQNFFKHGDRYQHIQNEKVDKYVTDEFLIHTVYGCHVVVTNATSSRQKLDVLFQVPLGAIPVSNGKYTLGVHVDIQPYRTQTFEYYFYFPQPGKYAHFPVHVAKNEQLIGFAPPVVLNVVAQSTRVDRTSWNYLSQHGTPDEVVAYLNTNNIHRLKLARIAWRMQDAAYSRKVLALLAKRHAYDHTLWSYGIKHNDLPAVVEYLQHANSFVAQCGPYIRSKPLTIDPVARMAYQHMEYSPLVNARAHQLGKRRKIVNERQLAQYNRLLAILTCRAALDSDDLMAVTYYLLLQDRVDEAIGFFKRVDPKKLATKIQHDYFAAYVAFYLADLKTAGAVVAKYKDHGVDRWREAFGNISAQLAEIQGRAAAVTDKKDRTQVQTKLAATEASLDFKVEARKVTVHYQNVKQTRVNYYLMDVESLFSRSPFVQQYSDQFSYIRPNQTMTVDLPAGKAAHTFDLPKDFHNRNVMVELIAGGIRKTGAYYPNSLAVQTIENYGQVKVSHAETGKPLAKVYVKVYSRRKDGQIQFYKDGYTDLRGRFDYTSLNTNELDFTSKFSLLILSETDGAVVREANPPKQ